MKSYDLSEMERDRVCEYILATSVYRQMEKETWEKLAKEKLADGSPKYPHAEGNVQYYVDLEADLAKLLKKLDW